MFDHPDREFPAHFRDDALSPGGAPGASGSRDASQALDPGRSRRARRSSQSDAPALTPRTLRSTWSGQSSNSPVGYVVTVAAPAADRRAIPRALDRSQITH
jgi:hypothetical protein